MLLEVVLSRNPKAMAELGAEQDPVLGQTDLGSFDTRRNVCDIGWTAGHTRDYQGDLAFVSVVSPLAWGKRVSSSLIQRTDTSQRKVVSCGLITTGYITN